MSTKPIGIMGGTFNPVHHGHLRSALDISDALSLTNVILMPTYMSPHKASNNIDTTHRLAMLKLAVQESPVLQTSDYEIKRQQVSYTAQTIDYFRAEHPQTPLCFLMGMDSFMHFTTWHRWQDILKQCHLVISPRPGYEIAANSDAAKLLAAHQTSSVESLHRALGGFIFLHHAHPLSISSSGIRDLQSNKQPITFLTPPRVEAYINTHQLYSAPI